MKDKEDKQCFQESIQGQADPLRIVPIPQGISTPTVTHPSPPAEALPVAEQQPRTTPSVRLLETKASKILKEDQEEMVQRFAELLAFAEEGDLKNYFVVWTMADGTVHSSYLNDSYLNMVGLVEWVKTRMIADNT